MPEPSDLIGELVDGLDPGAFVTRWVIVAEVIDTEGERAVWMDTSDDATPWDTLGLLEYALQRERSAQVVDRMREDDDG